MTPIHVTQLNRAYMAMKKISNDGRKKRLYWRCVNERQRNRWEREMLTDKSLEWWKHWILAILFVAA